MPGLPGSGVALEGARNVAVNQLHPGEENWLQTGSGSTRLLSDRRQAELKPGQKRIIEFGLEGILKIIQFHPRALVRNIFH